MKQPQTQTPGVHNKMLNWQLSLAFLFHPITIIFFKEQMPIYYTSLVSMYSLFQQVYANLLLNFSIYVSQMDTADSYAKYRRPITKQIDH